MDILTPCLYAEYGRYIGRFRHTPYYKDSLKMVQRRLMLVMSQFPRKTLKKSARMIGDTLGNYHPHGDMSVYDALLTLVNQGYVHGRGNWGGKGKTDGKQAAYRYTECYLKPWVYDLAFEYSSSKFIDWGDIEFEMEPIYLPSPISLGLIGNGIITGISFYKTVIPKYKLIDLAKRLEWILRKNNGKPGKLISEDIPDNYDKEKYGPIIRPHITDCKVSAPNKEFYNILTTGKGTFKTIPYGELKKCSKKMSPTEDYISVKGRSPNVTFNPLVKATAPNEKTKEIKLDLEIKAGNQKEKELIRIFPRRKKSVPNGSMKNIMKELWETYLIKDIHINCLVCIDEMSEIDGEPKVIFKEKLRSIDQLLIYSYIEWRNAFLKKRVFDFEKEVEKYFSLCVLKEVREIFENNKSKSVDAIIKKYFEKHGKKPQEIILEKYDINKNQYVQYTRPIVEKDIHDCVTKNSTKKLIEIEIDTSAQIQKIINCKNLIGNIDTDAYNRIVELSTKEVEYA